MSTSDAEPSACAIEVTTPEIIKKNLDLVMEGRIWQCVKLLKLWAPRFNGYMIFCTNIWKSCQQDECCDCSQLTTNKNVQRVQKTEFSSSFRHYGRNINTQIQTKRPKNSLYSGLPAEILHQKKWRPFFLPGKI